jgi:hypothetical protein
MSGSSSCWWLRLGFRGRDRRDRKLFTTDAGERKGMVAIPFGYNCASLLHTDSTMPFYGKDSNGRKFVLHMVPEYKMSVGVSVGDMLGRCVCLIESD